MKNWLKDIDPSLQSLLQEIGGRAGAKGISAFVVGGFVRDIIFPLRKVYSSEGPKIVGNVVSEGLRLYSGLGLSLSKDEGEPPEAIFLRKGNLDIDIVVNGDVLGLAQELSRDFNASLIVYKQFRTATVVMANGMRIDFAGTRKEIYEHDGALPVVSEGMIRDDLFRRDFTVNAMAVSIDQKSFGELRDDFNGLADLKARRIKILHPRSFLDDPTRILRAVRFEQRLKFRIEAQTLRLMKAALKKGAVSCVKPPRYFDEFKKIFFEDNSLRPLNRLADLNGLGFLTMRPGDFKKSLPLLRKVISEIGWFQRRFPDKRIQGWLVQFMALTSQVSARRLQALIREFHFTREDSSKVMLREDIFLTFKKLQKSDIKPSQVFLLLKPLPYEAIVFLKALGAGPGGKSLIGKYVKDFLLKFEGVSLKINGDDLIRLGVPLGKMVGEVLEKILFSKLDGKIHSKDEELKMVRQLQFIERR